MKKIFIIMFLVFVILFTFACNKSDNTIELEKDLKDDKTEVISENKKDDNNELSPNEGTEKSYIDSFKVLDEVEVEAFRETEILVEYDTNKDALFVLTCDDNSIETKGLVFKANKIGTYNLVVKEINSNLEKTIKVTVIPDKNIELGINNGYYTANNLLAYAFNKDNHLLLSSSLVFRLQDCTKLSKVMILNKSFLRPIDDEQSYYQLEFKEIYFVLDDCDCAHIAIIKKDNTFLLATICFTEEYNLENESYEQCYYVTSLWDLTYSFDKPEFNSDLIENTDLYSGKYYLDAIIFDNAMIGNLANVQRQSSSFVKVLDSSINFEEADVEFVKTFATDFKFIGPRFEKDINYFDLAKYQEKYPYDKDLFMKAYHYSDEYFDYYLVIDSNNNYYLLNGKTKDGKFQLSGVSKVINISNNYFE